MPHDQDPADTVTSLLLSERKQALHVLAADGAESGSFSAEQQSILSRRSTTPPDRYLAWGPARDAMLRRLFNST